MSLLHYLSTPLGRRVVITCLVMLTRAGGLLAQSQPPDPWEQGRVRIGPVAFTPGLTMKNLGWDNNVFYDTENPRGDFTVTPGVTARWWLRLGNLRLLGSESAEYVYFAQYATERGVNYRHEGRLEYHFNRIRPYTSGFYASIKDRPGYEIDARLRHNESAFGGGVLLLVSTKSRLDLGGRQGAYRFDGDPLYQDAYLGNELDRASTTGSALLRHSLTPLTTMTFLAEAAQDRFDNSPLRDSNSFRILPGVEFDPFALLKGSARFGYRKLDMTSPTIPDFSGVVADVNLRYVLLGRTQFALVVTRDIQYSYDVNQPYYVLTGATGSIRRGLASDWDIEARATTQRLEYRQVIDADQSSGGQTDRVKSFGGGVGYKLGPGQRLAFNVDYYRRFDQNSPGYNAVRWGLSATYEF